MEKVRELVRTLMKDNSNDLSIVEGGIAMGPKSGQIITLADGREKIIGVTDSPNYAPSRLFYHLIESLKGFWNEDSPVLDDPYANPRNIVNGRPMLVKTATGERYLGVPNIRYGQR